MSFTQDPFRPGEDDAEVMALRAKVWGADHPHGSPAFFDWLYAKNPLGPGGGVMLRREGRAVAFAGLSRRRARVGGRTFDVAHGLEYMVDPAFRGGGAGGAAIRLARLWAEHATQAGFAFGINFPNASSVRILTSDRVGWRRIVAPKCLALPLPSGRFADRAPGGLPAPLATIGLRALGCAAALARLGRPGGDIAEVDRFDARFDALWRRAADGAGPVFQRDAAVLNWRYVDHPVYRYRVLADGRDDVRAFIVTTPRKLLDIDCLLIVDGLAGDEDFGALTGLVREAARRAAAQGLGMLVAQAAPGSPLARALGRSGFVGVPDRFNPKPFVMVGLPLAGGGEAAFRPEGWRLAWGDMDVV